MYNLRLGVFLSDIKINTEFKQDRSFLLGHINRVQRQSTKDAKALPVAETFAFSKLVALLCILFYSQDHAMVGGGR